MDTKMLRFYRIILFSFILIFSNIAVAEKTTSYAQEAPVDSIAISPGDTVVAIGDSVTFTAIAFDSNLTVIDTTFTWSISNELIGSVDSTGLFTAVAAGEGYVVVSFNSLKDSAHVAVADTSAGEVINMVTIQKIKQNGLLHPKIDIVQEGSDEYKFSGFPSPLNFLNGGRLRFPMGSLSQDITIMIKLPQFTKIEGDSVSCFESGDPSKVIASGAEFIVMMDGDTISPYNFDAPISVSLPYKRGLLSNLGLNPEDLSIAFFSDAEFDTSGVTNSVIEKSKNRINADIAHFSIVVLYGETEVTGIDDSGLIQIPNEFVLEQNYPNPFNPETKIVYHIPAMTRVSITIHNLLGQEVRTLIDKAHSEGNYEVIWDSRNNLGHPVSSGIYIYQLKAENFVTSKRMIVIR